MSSHPTRSTLLWIALALAGLVVAVGVSYAASQLSKPRVGLASEPVSGVEQLAPERRAPAPSRTTTEPERPSQTGDDGDGDADDD